ncbi:hypothetical protein GCM10009789_87690 [Kribbella sancticallisti]|uniref:Uncharacterized protein n=1 Tax=Kribbella sancticallisti TaxID=460087 RepID=A0ABP4QYF8_9ACTN
MNDRTRGTLKDGTHWPDLRAAQDFDCDGENPTTGCRCVLGYHNGYHRDSTGAEWLDD